ncbi:DNA internalization-related competence protein ComEC/Rec2 [Marinicellulosiphila megalodicopiae]|uniref:DNA internalization-related competence protein ComEC/Rec2 n=1 Tax=Marinicellulosiphila megalodicopiae TaxID=2724896 RepID=UPI003BB03B17
MLTLTSLIGSVFIFYYSSITFTLGLILWMSVCACLVVLHKILNIKWQAIIVMSLIVVFNWSHLFLNAAKQFKQTEPIKVTAQIVVKNHWVTYDYSKVSEAIIQYEHEGKTIKTKVKLNTDLNYLIPDFCQFDATVMVSRLRQQNNRYIFDSAKWNFIKGIQAKASVVEQLTDCKNNTTSIREKIRQRILTMQKLDTNSKAMVLAILFGDQTQLSDETKAVFVDTQTVHLIVVSGLHIGVSAWLAWLMGQLIFQLIPVRFLHYHGQTINIVIMRKHIQIVCVIGLVLFYGYLAQFNPPALRAILMLFIPLLLWLFNQKLRLLLIWSYSLIGLILIMPAQVLSMGFWMSVICVTGLMMYFSIRVSVKTQAPNLLQKTLNFIKQLIKTQWVIFLVMTPIVMFMGTSVHFLSSLINLILVPIITLLLLPLGLVLMILDFEILQTMVNYLCQFVLWLLTRFNVVTKVEVNIDLLQLIILELAAFSFICHISHRYLMMSVFGLMLFVVAPKQQKQGEFIVKAMDVGQGQSIIIETKTTQWIVDVGPGLNDKINSVNRVLIPYLKQHNKPTRILALSHDDSDHAFASHQLVQTIKFDKKYSGQPQRFEFESQNCRAQQSLKFDEVSFTWLNLMDFQSDNDNDYSCVLKVKSKFGSIIISGDLSKYGEYYLMQNQLIEPVDLVVLGHHGSKSSTSDKWLLANDSELGLVSRALDNHFGHPHVSVIDKVNNQKMELLDTAIQGQVRIEFGGQGIKVNDDRHRMSY